ncbi:Nucleobase-ascorbate transporter 8 [Capsicum chinense]|nr:Nucleobase-ascorbate transporter 8 [Capsicum chinense]
MAGGGAAPAAKSDDPAPHPTKDQLPNVSYCITSPPPWPEAILLGFQHYIVMLGTTVIIPTALVPQMGGGNEEKAKVIQTLLFVSGLNTLLQTSFGTRLPAVIGGSYTFVAPTISIILSGRWEDPDPVSRFKKIMRATQGALIVASTLQIVLGFSGLWRNVVRFLTPLSAVPLVSLVGFGLYEFGFPGVAKCVEVGLPQLVLLVIFSQYLAHLVRPGKHIFDRFAVLFTVAIVWIYAYILTLGGAYNGKSLKTQISCRTDRAGLIGAAPWRRHRSNWFSPCSICLSMSLLWSTCAKTAFRHPKIGFGSGGATLDTILEAFLRIQQDAEQMTKGLSYMNEKLASIDCGLESIDGRLANFGEHSKAS